MKKFIILISFIFGCAFTQASDTKKEAIDLLAHKTIADFQKAIEIYNQKKDESAPAIKRIGKQNYNLVVKTTTVRFSLVNYLNDQMYVNDQLVEKSTFSFKKNSNATEAKILTNALSSFSANLEEIGLMCFSGCQEKTREANLKKIINTLEQQRNSCNEQLYAREDSVKKHPSFRMVSLLHSAFNPEFQSVRNFYLKVAETNKKSVETFMSKKMKITKGYESCIGAMSAGTIVDKNLESLGALESARNICVKMDELKNCLVNLKKIVSTANSIKRNSKKVSQ